MNALRGPRPVLSLTAGSQPAARAMDINRNHWLITGLVLLALGVQFRLVESIVLNEKCTQFIEERLNEKVELASVSPFSGLMSSPPPSHRTISPPRWIGWALLSVGGVMVVHSLTFRRPD